MTLYPGAADDPSRLPALTPATLARFAPFLEALDRAVCRMKFAFDVAPLGDLADPLTIVRLAEASEAAGWDGFSTWDTLGLAQGTVAADPFVALAGAAAATERIALLASVIVLPRRRPQLVAQAAATLDRLSGGRLILGVGPAATSRTSRRSTRTGRRPCESRAWTRRSGRGRVPARRDRLATRPGLPGPRRGHRSAAGAAAPPADLDGRDPTRRHPPLARWDGWIAISTGDDPQSLGCRRRRWPNGSSWRARPGSRRGSTDPFDVAVFGIAGLGGFTPADYAAAGATWWLESVTPQKGSVAEILAIAKAGPPR